MVDLSKVMRPYYYAESAVSCVPESVRSVYCERRRTWALETLAAPDEIEGFEDGGYWSLHDVARDALERLADPNDPGTESGARELTVELARAERTGKPQPASGAESDAIDAVLAKARRSPGWAAEHARRVVREHRRLQRQAKRAARKYVVPDRKPAPDAAETQVSRDAFAAMAANPVDDLGIPVSVFVALAGWYASGVCESLTRSSELQAAHAVLEVLADYLAVNSKTLTTSEARPWPVLVDVVAPSAMPRAPTRATVTN